MCCEVQEHMMVIKKCIKLYNNTSNTNLQKSCDKLLKSK